MRYIFARNINHTEINGIVDLSTSKTICVCDEANSTLLLNALNSYNDNKAGGQVAEIQYYLMIKRLMSKENTMSDDVKCEIVLSPKMIDIFGIEFYFSPDETSTSKLERFMKTLDDYMNEYYPLI